MYKDIITMLSYIHESIDRDLVQSGHCIDLINCLRGHIFSMCYVKLQNIVSEELKLNGHPSIGKVIGRKTFYSLGFML